MRFAFLILITALPLTCFAQLGDPAFVASLELPAAAGGGATYLVDQDFEGAGYDNGETWSETGATVDEDYTGVVLDGSQSLRVAQVGAVGYTAISLSAIGEVWFYALMRVVTPADSLVMAFRTTGGGSILCFIRVASGTSTVTIRHGSSEATTVDAMSTGTTYHVWARYTKGSGSDGIASVAFSTDGIRPTSGNKFASVSDGTSTGDAGQIILGRNVATTQEFLWDKVRVDDVQIGDSPP